MLPGTLMHLPAVALLAFANVTLPSLDSAEEPAPRPPDALQPAGRWSTASWEPCSNPCGAGEEQRRVSCVLEDAESTLIVATDGFCAPPRPTGARPCYQYRSECANTWVTGDWGQCSAKCGGGQRSRVVECHAGSVGVADGKTDAGAAPTAPPPDAGGAVPRPLPDGQCVAQLRPAERRDCNLQPCPDGRRVWLRISDDRKPRRIRLFSKFTLRCPFHVYWTPADDRSKRKYAWFKDGRRLPIHEDKYTQTDSRGELRVKGADEPDSGVYTCASTTANPQGRSHNTTVKLERVPGEPTPTIPPPKTEDDAEDDSPEASPEQREDAVDETTDAETATPTAATAEETTTVMNDSLTVLPVVEEVTDNSLPSPPPTSPPEDGGENDKTTQSVEAATPRGLEEEELPAEQQLARRKRDTETTDTEAPGEVDDDPASSTAAPEQPEKDTGTDNLNQTEDAAAVGKDVSDQTQTGAPTGTDVPEEEEEEDDDYDEDSDDIYSSRPNGAIDVVAARYDATPFSSCTAPCGPSGLRQRAVRCVDNESSRQLPLSACEDLGPPPPPQVACNRIDCPPKWEWPSWSGIKCSRTCGGGAKWRQARCSQTLADGADVTLAAESCAALGTGEERRGCRRAACRRQVRDGEVLRLDCLAANVTWRHNGSALELGDADKYLANDDTGMLLVYRVAPRDAGQYLCDEAEAGGTTSTHRFDVTVLPPMPRPSDGEIFVRVWDSTTERSESLTSDNAPPTGAGTEDTLSNADWEDDEVEGGEEPQAAGPSFPWQRLFAPAAALRGRVLGIFS